MQLSWSDHELTHSLHTRLHKMWPSGSCARLAIVAACLVISGVQGLLNISEPDRQTHMYGQSFVVALPPNSLQLVEAGSFLQIACVSVGSDPLAEGSIAFIGEGYTKQFTAAPTVSVKLDGIKPFLQNRNISVLDITSDSDITVTLILQIGQTLSAYTALPVASLDKMYLAASYGLLQDNLSELTVVATSRKQTVVQFYPNAENVTLRYSGGHLSLSRGQAYIYGAPDDFLGGHLMCDEPVMGLVGSRCSPDQAGYCSGRSMDILYPLVSLGTRFTAVAVKSPDVSGVFRAVAVWNNTRISWSSQKPSSSGSVTLANGYTVDVTFDVHETGTFEGSKPFLLLHHVEMGTPASDIALVSVPPYEQLTRKAITFATYPADSPEQQRARSFITIINPCDSEILLQRIPSSLPRTVSPDLPTVVRLRDNQTVCGSSRELEPGVYTLGVSPDQADGSYSAILYTVTKSGVAAHVLATELNQVVCSVESSEEVHLCPAIVSILPPQTTLSPEPTPSSKPIVTTPGGQRRHGTGGTIIAVVIVVLSLVAGAVVISILMIRYCRGRRWKRLEESDYMEDNPIRLQVLEQGL